MRTIEHTIDIDAPAETVWKVVRDFDHYGDWNPFMKVNGSPHAVGDKLEITVRPPGRKGTSFEPTVTTYEEGRSLQWLGRVLVPGIFDGAHELTVESRAGGGSRFVQRETFRGVLVPFTGKVLRDTTKGFAAMNNALKARAEAAAAA